MSKKDIEGQLNIFELFQEPLQDNLQVKTKKENDCSFPECKKCWCNDCKHNSRGEKVPRKFGTEMLPCPACEPCINNHKAEICIIGSAKEGCRTRALEEGILKELS